jgi:predicted DNA-binding ArsR family transcriptional regulator
MPEFVGGVLSHTVAILLAAVITFVITLGVSKILEGRRGLISKKQAIAAIEEARWRAREDVKKEFRQKYEAALPALARSLAKLILTPMKDDDVESHARAIVQTRDEMRKTISNLNDLLNSEIDVLQRLLREAEKGKVVRREDILKTIKTLQITWSEGKVERIQIALRRLLAENGLSEISGDEPQSA